MTPDEIKVELRPHCAQQRTKIGVLETPLGQQMVFANGVHVGYIDNRPGAGVKLINLGLPQSARDAIKQKVDAIRGCISPPVANSAPILEEDD